MKLVQGHGINDMPRGWASENEWNKRVYRLWCNKLRYCFDEIFHQTKIGKNYIGCTLCERWLTLSNFVTDVPLIDGYDKEMFLNGELELDKDIKSNGTKKIYCMKECTFVTKPENIKQSHKTRYNYLDMQGENNPMYGKHHNEETRRKISENHAKNMLGKLGSEHPKSKQVAQYDKQTHELIRIWDSLSDVQRELGIAQSSISRCCKGKYKSAGGFIWKYVEDE